MIVKELNLGSNRYTCIEVVKTYFPHSFPLGIKRYKLSI